MKLAEMKKRPSKIGNVKIVIGKKCKKSTSLSIDSLSIFGLEESIDWYWLKDKTQFLVKVKTRYEDIYVRKLKKTYYYGGEQEDKSIFFIKICKSLLNKYLRNGEKGFFKAIIPKHITRTSKMFKSPVLQYQSFFLVKIPVEVEDVKLYKYLLGKDGLSPDELDVNISILSKGGYIVYDTAIKCNCRKKLRLEGVYLIERMEDFIRDC